MKNTLPKILGVLVTLSCLTSCNVEGNSSKKTDTSFNSTNNNSTIISTLPNNSNSSTSNELPIGNDNLPIAVQLFIGNVEKINFDELSLEDKSTLDGAVFIYNTLSPSDKELIEVIRAKELLDRALDSYNSLYDEYLMQRESEEIGYAFADLVANIKDLDSLIREDEELVTNLLIKYESLSDRTKSLSVVINAKESLDAANAKIQELIDLNDEEYAIILFTASVNKLPNINDLTILDVDKVEATLTIYNELSKENKNDNNVMAAKEILDILIERTTELKLIQEHADAFIELVYALPSYSQLEWRNSSQETLIIEAETAYENLTEEEKLVIGVSRAITQLQTIRNVFDNLKQPYDINKIAPRIDLGPMNNDKNYTSTFTYASNQDHITILTKQYGIAREELKNHVRVYLNLYYEAGAIATDPLYKFDITEDYSGYDINKYIEVLQKLNAEGNAKAISGHGYNFTVNIESVSDLYASSKYTNFFGGQKINF